MKNILTKISLHLLHFPLLSEGIKTPTSTNITERFDVFLKVKWLRHLFHGVEVFGEALQ